MSEEFIQYIMDGQFFKVTYTTPDGDINYSFFCICDLGYVFDDIVKIAKQKLQEENKKTIFVESIENLSLSKTGFAIFPEIDNPIAKKNFRLKVKTYAQQVHEEMAAQQAVARDRTS